MESATEIREIHIYRCEACRRLICYELAIERLNANKQSGICKCGSRKVRSTIPSNWSEDFICIGWQVKVAWRNFRNRNK